MEKLLNLLIEEKTEQCTLSADHEQNEKKLLCSIRACLTGDISMSKQQKSPHGNAELRRDVSS
ncbi:hypothetical protein DS98104_09 [Lactococcus phage 98104]|nr:hypothetical protein DS98104_09 [Lactococcus phage 98104]